MNVLDNKIKLHIYGCSHSTAYKCNHHDFWADRLSKKLKIYEGAPEGSTGKGYPHIFSKILDDVSRGYVKKNDIVILNTSYENRYTVPFVGIEQLDDNIREIKTDWQPKINEETHTKNGLRVPSEINGDVFNTNLIFNEPEIIIDWYNKTKFAYDILSNVCDNVFQWTLASTNDIEILRDLSYNYSKKFSNKFEDGIHQVFTHRHFDIDCGKNKWINLINPPVGYDSWSNFIFDNPFSESDRHMNTNGHHIMSNEIYNQIKNNIK